MMDYELTLLNYGQILGNSNESQLEVISKYGAKAAITDLCILTGVYLCEDTIDEDRSLTGRTSWFWTRSDDDKNDVRVIDKDGNGNIGCRVCTQWCCSPSFAIFCNLFPNLHE